MFDHIYIKFTGGAAVAVMIILAGCVLTAAWEAIKFVFKVVMVCLMRN